MLVMLMRLEYDLNVRSHVTTTAGVTYAPQYNSPVNTNKLLNQRKQWRSQFSEHKKYFRNEASQIFDKACLTFVWLFADLTYMELMARFMKKSAEKRKIYMLGFVHNSLVDITYQILFFSEMDGLGSPDMMDHSMLDLKNSSPYSCYASPKLSYDSFSHNRGNITLTYIIINYPSFVILGLNLELFIIIDFNFQGLTL